MEGSVFIIDPALLSDTLIISVTRAEVVGHFFPACPPHTFFFLWEGGRRKGMVVVMAGARFAGEIESLNRGRQ